MSGRPPTRYVLGIDVSTNGAKALVVEEAGQVVSEGRAAFETFVVGRGGFEQQAIDWWDALVVAVRGALARLTGEQRAHVEALAVAHQRETFVLCDDDGSPLAPAIVWMDERAKPEVREVTRALGAERIAELSGKPPCVTPSLYKIRMQLGRLVPELRGRHQLRVAEVHAFLARRLVGRWITSVASADPLGLVEMRSGEASPELCEAALVTPEALPALVRPGSVLGSLAPAAALELGLPTCTKVIAGAGDGQAAALGLGVTAPSELYLNLGTAFVGGACSDDYVVGRAFRTLFAASGGYLLEMDLKGGALSFDWLAHRIAGREHGQRAAALAEWEREAAHLPPGAEGLLFVPYLAGVMNPTWNDDVGGALLGLRAHHGPAHLYRAMLEGLAFEQATSLQELEAETATRSRVRVTGGVSASELGLQVFADVLGRPLERSHVTEATALGAAMLSATGAGWMPTARDVARAWVVSQPTREPSTNRAPYATLVRQYRRARDASMPYLTALGRTDEHAG
jgi:xylulokinase